MKKMIVLTGVLFGLLFSGCAVNPITGEQQLMLLPEQQDLEIGRTYAPEVEKQMGGRIPNAQLQNYVNNVGQQLARVSQRPDWPYQFVVLDDKTVNAFALPGGYVFVTKGILDNLTSEAQLAGVLSHEIAHIVARHSAAQMSQQIGMELLLSAVANQGTSKGVMAVADIARQIIGLKFSRGQELEADSAGLDYMVRAGYNPYGMVETTRMLEETNRVRPIEFLSTHPSPENRIEMQTSKIQRSYANTASLKTGQEDYRRYVLANLK